MLNLKPSRAHGCAEQVGKGEVACRFGLVTTQAENMKFKRTVTLTRNGEG